MSRYGRGRGLGGAILAALLSGGVAVAEGGSFEATGSLAGGARSQAVAVRLGDGRVLVAGGTEDSGTDLDSAELYDPDTGTFAATGSMDEGRIRASAHLLPDGRVLVAGGTAQGGPTFSSTEIFDPSSETFSAGPSMSTARAYHRTAVLEDGRILAVGGNVGSVSQLTADVYDPEDGDDGSWTATGSMSQRRQEHSVVRLADGRVLVAGGSAGSEGGFAALATCEIWDPDSGTFSSAASLPAARSGAKAALLPDGRVLLAGGHGASGLTSHHDALYYDPDDDSWSTAGTITSGGPGVSLTQLDDGTFLLAGGAEMPGQDHLDEADLFDPSTGDFSAVGPMVDGRTNHDAVLLEDGSVLIVSGTFKFAEGIGRGRATAELFVPNHAPVADAGDDQVVECTGASGASVTLDGSGSSDPDGDGLTFSWTGVFGTVSGASPSVTLPEGTHTIVLTVVDGPGAVDSDEVTVIVQDTTAPVVSEATADPAVLWPPDHRMVEVTIGAVVTDACGGTPTLEILSVESNEPEDGLGDGDTAVDWVITGDTTVELRAERSGKGTGRVYTITLVATDDDGNETFATVPVRVPKSRK